MDLTLEAHKAWLDENGITWYVNETSHDVVIEARRMMTAETYMFTSKYSEADAVRQLVDHLSIRLNYQGQVLSRVLADRRIT